VARTNTTGTVAPIVSQHAAPIEICQYIVANERAVNVAAFAIMALYVTKRRITRVFPLINAVSAQTINRVPFIAIIYYLLAQKCDENEYWDVNGEPCIRTSENPRPKCLFETPQPGCVCNTGYRRNANTKKCEPISPLSE